MVVDRQVLSQPPPKPFTPLTVDRTTTTTTNSCPPQPQTFTRMNKNSPHCGPRPMLPRKLPNPVP